MRESEFRSKIAEFLEKEIPSYRVREHQNLLYQVIVNEQLEFEPDTPVNPRRGNHAFQADIVIFRENLNLPLVVLETKYGGFSSHDIITYSTKAIKHKGIYPYIRYGLIIGGREFIDRRFFTHNIGFDFAIAMNNLSDSEFIKLSSVVKEQIESAETLIRVFSRRQPEVKFFNSKLIIETAR